MSLLYDTPDPPVGADFPVVPQSVRKHQTRGGPHGPADLLGHHVAGRLHRPDQVRKLKETAGRDLTVGGPHLAAQAIAAGLVDEYQFYLVPAVVGGGTRALPDRVRLDLALADERRFGNGTVYLRYHPA